MQSIVLGYNWLSTFLVVTTIQQRLIQAVHPALSPLLQLPCVSTKLAEKLAKENSISSPEQYFVLPEEEKRKLFPDIQGVEQKRLAAISEKWPKLELISSEFKGLHILYNVTSKTIHYTNGRFVYLNYYSNDFQS